jgi:hypothetical protein
MTTAITIFLCLAAFHFVYESIVAPSLRMVLRHELFALRDRLRGVKATEGSKLEDQHFHYLQDSLNVQIRYLHVFDMWLLINMKMVEAKDGTVAKRIASRKRVLDDCSAGEAHEIRAESIRISLKILTVNSGGWFIYLVPVIFAMICYNSVRDLMKSLISMPEPDLDKMRVIRRAPQSQLMAQ